MDFLEIAERYAKGDLLSTDTEVREVEKLLMEMASTEDGRQEIAEVIGIYIDKVFPKFDIAPYLCHYRNFDLGQRPEFRLKKKGIKAYWIAPNSSTPKSRNYQETLTMEFETISARPELFLDEIKSGRIQGFADMLKDTAEAIEKGVAAKVFVLLTQVYNEQNEKHCTVDTGALTEASVKDAIDLVGYETGNSPVVIGDLLLVKQIFGFEGDVLMDTDTAKDTLRNSGWLGRYYGADLVGIPKITDNFGSLVVPNNRLYVVGSKIGYAGTYGPVKSGQETSIEDWSWNARLDKSWGMTVTEGEGMHVIEVQ